MIEYFIREYVKKIVSKPELIDIQIQDVESDTRDILILADSEDIGRLIGRDGKMVASLKTFISATKAKDGKKYRIAVQTH